MTATITASRPRALPLLAVTGLLAGPFLSMVDSNIVNVALPDIAGQLHTSLDTAQWIVSGYLLALAALLAATAYLAKRFGTLRVYLVSLLGFTLASALCALAPSISFLIVMRVLQGMLGAPMVPLAMNILLRKDDSARQMPVVAGMILFLAPAIGPTAGGLLIRAWGWPLIFLVNVPFGLLGALGTLRIPHHLAERSDPGVRFDLAGMLLLASGVVLALYGATQGPQAGWGSVQSWPYLVGGGLLLAVYILWALLRKHPAVDLKLLRHPQPALAVALCTLAGVIMFSMLFLIPIFMEDLQRTSALTAGLALLPQGLVTGVGTVLGDKLAPRWGMRASAALGMLILTLCTAALLLIGLSTPAWVTALILSGRGLAIGLTIQPLLLSMIGGLSPEEVPDGNTLFNVAERLGGSIGISLLATFFAARETTQINGVLQVLGIHLSGGQSGASLPANLPIFIQSRLADAAINGFHDTIWLLVALSALGLCATLLLHKKPAEAPNEALSTSERPQAVQA
jgi:EmrB/QacA subfamily drug resistance transporter